jgi:hypothetical protein|tara:strand:+ start:1094 stop:1789 length:696 start_codon:yes stop_codon:yes gene_type:complete
MRPQVLTSLTLTNDANGIFQDQTTSGAATLTLNGALVESGIAYCYGAASDRNIHQAQLIAIEGSGNNSGVVATILGTGPGSEVTGEDLTLSNAGTATSAKYYKTITSIVVGGAVTGNIEGGWLSGSTDPAVLLAFKCDYTQAPMNQSLRGVISSGASLTWSAQYTMDMPQDDYGTVGFDNSAAWSDVDGMAATATTDQGNTAFPVTAVRLEINSYSSGTIKFTAIQGHSGY